MPEICLKLTVKTPERRLSRRSGVLLLTLNVFHTFSNVSIVGFEQMLPGMCVFFF